MWMGCRLRYSLFRDRGILNKQQILMLLRRSKGGGKRRFRRIPRHVRWRYILHLRPRPDGEMDYRHEDHDLGVRESNGILRERIKDQGEAFMLRTAPSKSRSIPEARE